MYLITLFILHDNTSHLVNQALFILTTIFNHIKYLKLNPGFSRHGGYLLGQFQNPIRFIVSIQKKALVFRNELLPGKHIQIRKRKFLLGETVFQKICQVFGSLSKPILL